MYDDNENFKLFDDDEEFDSPTQNIVDIIENGFDIEEENNTDITTELDINRKNREGYEQLMKDSSTQLDGYWDINNAFVKAVLIGLLVVIAIGSLVIFGAYFTS